MIEATAPGKIILFGEHAVVYGRPAIAAPLSQLRASAVVTAGTGDGIRLVAPDLGLDERIVTPADSDALGKSIQQVQQITGAQFLPPLTLTVRSDIPIASGLGSGAAIAAATIRALAHYLGYVLDAETVSALTYEVEKIHHGTPSGIDNTVVAYEQPVYFVRQQPRNRVEPFAVAQPLHLLVGNTGVRSSTKTAVLDVRRQWLAEPARFEAIFDACGRIARAARQAIESGNAVEVGRLMRENHTCLQRMTVSSRELDELVAAATAAGALGAKLSGGGRGGNMIALVSPETETAVAEALRAAGATAVLRTIIQRGNMPQTTQ